MISTVRPTMPRAPFAAELAAWPEAGIVGRGTPPAGAAAVVVVPQYLRAAPAAVLLAPAARDWRDVPVAVVAHGGRDRGRFAVDELRSGRRPARSRPRG